MNKNIIILVLLTLFCSVNIVNAEILDEGEFIVSTSESEDLLVGCRYGSGGVTPNLYVSDFTKFSPITYVYIDVPDAYFQSGGKATYDSWTDTIELKDGVTLIATGTRGYFLKPNGDYRVWLWLDIDSYNNVYWDSLTTGKELQLIGTEPGYYGYTYASRDIYSYPDGYGVLFSSIGYCNIPGTYSVYTLYNFKNTYHTELKDNLMYEIYVDKTHSGFVQWSNYTVKNNSNEILYEEEDLNQDDLYLNLLDNDIPYTLSGYDMFNNYFTAQLEFVSTYDENALRIEVENINIDETLEVEYFNIDDLRTNPLVYGDYDYGTNDLYLNMYYDRYTYYELISSDIIIDESDSTVYYSTNNYNTGNYIIQITLKNKGIDEYAFRKEFSITQPLNFSISISPDTLFSGSETSVIYKCINTSTITIYDEDNTPIDIWSNVLGDNNIPYQIPIDSNYDLSYNEWYVYLNDSGNINNNLRYNFTVDWRVYIPEEPTPQPTEDYYNVTVEENVNEIREGINPILELVFGISTIFVDNPDYDDNNIIDVNEISVWLNSLITICIVIFIYILYKVYNRR